MSPKADPRDWDRLFRPGAPRRSGPLRVLANIIMICVALGILSGAALVAWGYRERAIESAARNESIVETSNAIEIASRTARSLTATAARVASASGTPTSASGTPTPASGTPASASGTPAKNTPTALPGPLVGRSSVTNGGNLRSEPVVSAATVIGQVCVSDKVNVLEKRTLARGALWYRIQITDAPIACTPQRVAVGSVGWVSATLLTNPTP
ncbi:MAG: SH3 domain-containing protein [Chloroflexales bacterium]